MSPPRLFTIPAGAPFLDVLAQAMLDGRFGLVRDPADPTAMARATLYLPTRRAARAFSARLAARLGGEPLLLPRIVPLGDVDEAETALIGAGAWSDARIGPIDPLARRMLLTRLVAAWGRTANRAHLRLDPAEPALAPATLAEAWALAGDLAALLDQMQTEGVPVERLRTLDAERFDLIWRLNASFLGILGEQWPHILAERAACDPADFRNRMLGAERERLLAGAATGPIIAAGSTGTIPATAALLGAIARLPHGAVVLPDLDLDLPGPAWDAIADEPAPSHPQAALRRLLERIGARRDQVVPLATPEPPRLARLARLREAMLPASVTQLWAGLGGSDGAAAAGTAPCGLRIVEAANERQEALCVAVALREALERPGLQAALVTPDRGLAERVGVELRRWDVQVDDSAGLPLSRWPAGALLRLVLEAALSELAPAAVVPLLAHPLVRLGLARGLVAQGASALEIGVWRGQRVGPGPAGLAASLAAFARLRDDRHAPGPRRRLAEADAAAADAVLRRLDEAMASLNAASAAPFPGFAAFAAAAKAALEGLTRDETGTVLAFAGPDGEALARLFDDLAGAAESAPPGGGPRDAVAMLGSLLAERVVRRAGPAHPRVKIWGLLEARLLEADHVVLGGLNEGVWPPEAPTDSFLNRPMRAELGLSPPERRIGQTAHDFVQAAMAPQVTLIRARKAGEAETIASRFWQRLQAVTPAAEWAQALARGADLARLAARLDAPAAAAPAARPAPKPPRRLQPLRLSVTEIETLYRDPYQLHARKILKLDALEDLAPEPGARDRGDLWHAIVEEFARNCPAALPAGAIGALLAIGHKRFAVYDAAPEVRAFWWPRFVLTAGHFVAWEERRRGDLALVAVERSTSARFVLADGAEFALSGRADRIELTRAPAFRIIDFKTGARPSDKEVATGFAPQLTLQAELAARAGFSGGLAPAPVEAVHYVRLHHDPKSWTDDGPLKLGGRTLADVAAEHLHRLLGHLDALRDGREPFISRRAPKKTGFSSPYDHLARVKEWSAAGGGEDDEEGAA